MSPSQQAICKRALSKRKRQAEAMRERKLKKALEKKKNRETTRHHRLPTALGGVDTEPNVIRVPKNHHQWWHNLFRIMPPLDIIRYMNRCWLPLDSFALVVPIDRAEEALLLLVNAGIVPTTDPRAYGATDGHELSIKKKKNGRHSP